MQREDLGCEYYFCGYNVNEVMINHIKIYPNPVSTEFYVQSDEIILDEVFIYTIQGQFINHIKLQEYSQKINIATLQAGIYLLKVKDMQKNIYTMKLIKL